MLTKGFKHEEQKKNDRMLYSGLQLAFVPETWVLEEKKKLDEILLNTAKISLNGIADSPIDELLEKLKTNNFSFSNIERLADLLIKTFPVEPDKRSNLAKKAWALYKFAQEEHKTYSFGLMEKIEKAKRNIDDSKK